MFTFIRSPHTPAHAHIHTHARACVLTDELFFYLSLVWMRPWRARSERREKALPQLSQAQRNGLESCWWPSVWINSRMSILGVYSREVMVVSLTGTREIERTGGVG